MSLSALLNRFLAARRTAEPQHPGASRVPYTIATLAGVSITPDLAMRNAVVWACHRYLTQSVAQLPARVMRVRKQGTGGRVVSERMPNHAVDWVLAWRANPNLAPFQFKETMVGWALMWGNGYAEIERDGAGRVIALWPIHPDRVQVKVEAATGALVYEVRTQGGVVDLAPHEMFHLRGFGNDVVGLSVIQYAAQSIGWAEATKLFGAAYFGEGMHPRLAVKKKGKLDDGVIKRMRAQFDALFKGPRRANRTIFLDDESDVTKIPIQPNEAQFVESMQFLVEEVTRWFGVPPHKVMHLLRSTNNNIEHQAIEVVSDAIVPWCIRFEEECNYKLFGQNRGGFFVKLDVKGLLRGDFKSRQEGLQIQRRNGVINGNDWCEIEDMPLVPGEDGEAYIVEGNMTTLKRLRDGPAKAGDEPVVASPPAVTPEAMSRIRELARGVLADAA